MISGLIVCVQYTLAHYQTFPLSDDDNDAVDDLHCRQLRAGAGTAECVWTVSSQYNEWVVFIWDALGELFARLTTSELSLIFEIPVAAFGNHFTVQIGQRTTELVLYGWFALICFCQYWNHRIIRDVRILLKIKKSFPLALSVYWVTFLSKYPKSCLLVWIETSEISSIDCKQFLMESPKLTCSWTASPRSNVYQVDVIGSNGHQIRRKVYREFVDLSTITLVLGTRYYIEVGSAVLSIFLAGSSILIMIIFMKIHEDVLCLSRP